MEATNMIMQPYHFLLKLSSLHFLSLTLPVLGLGAVIFVISIIGFLGAWKSNSILLWIYLIMLCFILIAILVFTVLAFIVTNNGSGHNVAGLRYKEYQLRDYSPWFLKQVH
ncbi:Tetraspanin-10 [Camellia lanceoleosa]|uniref:Tetraspanin-10 n=1 Tax=Camellia lanceoleosa TaxID=1840588 RepID=A0ACC0GB53_9ERIC|nr:Tetraspanin-10 [Camellia lanceoleosa]